MALTFPNPINGKPRPIQLDRLFLLHPWFTFKQEGHSLRKAFADRFNEAFARKMDRVLSQETKATPIAHDAQAIMPSDYIAGVAVILPVEVLE